MQVIGPRQRPNTQTYRWLVMHRSLCCGLIAGSSVQLLTSSDGLRLLDTREFLAVNGLTPYTTAPGWDCWRLWLDWMHIFDLALTPDAIASALMSFTDDKSLFRGPRRDDRLLQLYSEYKADCRTHGGLSNLQRCHTQSHVAMCF